MSLRLHVSHITYGLEAEVWQSDEFDDDVEAAHRASISPALAWSCLAQNFCCGELVLLYTSQGGRERANRAPGNACSSRVVVAAVSNISPLHLNVRQDASVDDEGDEDLQDQEVQRPSMPASL